MGDSAMANREHASRLARARGPLLVVALAAIAALVTLWWVRPSVNAFTIQTNGDQAWIQATVQSAMQVGPFAVNTHLGWSSGFDPWAYPPVGGAGFLTGAWLLGLLGLGSSDALALLLAGAAVAMTVATYLAVRLAAPGHVDRGIAAIGALAFGLSPYVLSKMGHVNVALVFLVPALLATIGYLRPGAGRSSRAIASAVALLAVATLLSSLWWQLITLAFLLAAVVVAALLRSRGWLRTVALALLGVALGSALPIGLTLARRVPGDSWNREPWDSTMYSGSLVDLLAASPLVRTLVPSLDGLLPATSRELSSVGLIPMVFGLIALAISLTAYLGYRGSRRAQAGWLLVALQLSLLAFLTMGLGTFGEALLWLVGIESPLRVWSRMIVLICLVGFLLVAPVLSAALARRTASARAALLVIAAIVCGAVIIGDARSTQMAPPRAVDTLEELPAIDYIRGTYGACPVAQLPLGTYPDFPLADGTALGMSYYYRGFVPYLLDPEGPWSYGAIKGTASDTLLRSLGPILDAPTLLRLREAGYCAVLYDQHYAEWLRAKGLGWPGEQPVGLTPAWQDGTRFVVYALSRSTG